MNDQEEIKFTHAGMMGMVLGMFIGFFVSLFGVMWGAGELGIQIGRWQISNEVQQSAWNCYLAYYVGDRNHLSEENRIKLAKGVPEWEECVDKIKTFEKEYVE